MRWRHESFERVYGNFDNLETGGGMWPGFRPQLRQLLGDAQWPVGAGKFIVAAKAVTHWIECQCHSVQA